MTAPRKPVYGTLDAHGRLIAADPPLAALHARAGGEAGGPLAVPPLAQVARQARRLGMVVSRGVVVADGRDDLDLWVSARPAGERVRLELVGWRVRTPPPAPPAVERDFLRAEHDWWWRADAALTLTALAPAAPGAELIGGPLADLVSLEPAPGGAMPLLDALAEQRRFDGQIATLRLGEGGRLRLSGAPVFDEAGKFDGFIGGAIRLPGARRSAADAPAEAFGERLGAALRGPLDRIIAAADAIGAREEGPLRRDYAGYAGDIASAGRHLLALVGDLVDLSAIERPDFRPEPEPLDLADLARRAAGLLALRALDGSVRVDPPAPDETLAAQGDFRRVLQILVNLVGNAIRYSPPGGAVSIRGETGGGVARLTVADRGRGVAPADHARIFDKFERVDPSEPGGTGLGLYIARRLARAMGGDVTVESARGQGARFTLMLPAV